MRCNIRSVNSTLRTARAPNDPYETNERNLRIADRYCAGVLDMSVQYPLRTSILVKEGTPKANQYLDSRDINSPKVFNSFENNILALFTLCRTLRF